MSRVRERHDHRGRRVSIAHVVLYYDTWPGSTLLVTYYRFKVDEHNGAT